MGRLAQRPVLAFAGPGPQVNVVVAVHVDVLVVGVVDLRYLVVEELPAKPVELAERERHVAGVPVHDEVGYQAPALELALNGHGRGRVRGCRS